jgi:hypothetical protein
VEFESAGATADSIYETRCRPSVAAGGGTVCVPTGSTALARERIMLAEQRVFKGARAVLLVGALASVAYLMWAFAQFQECGFTNCQ